MSRLCLMMIVFTLLVSAPVLSFAHPDLNYTKSFVRLSEGNIIYLDMPEKSKINECDWMGNCIMVTLTLSIMVIMVITISIIYRESYLRKW